MAARKTSTAPTRIWKFGALPPTENAKRVADDLFAARRYYNALIANERDRFERFRVIRRSHAPELADAEDKLAAIEVEIDAVFADARGYRAKEFRQTGRKTRDLPTELRARVEALRAEQKEISETSKALRKAFSERLEAPRAEFKRRATELAQQIGRGNHGKSEANATVLAEMLSDTQWAIEWRELAVSDDVAHKRRLAERKACSLTSGTKLQVEASVDQAIKTTEFGAPRFRRWDGGGKLAIQTRCTFGDILAGRVPSLHLSRAPRDPKRRGKRGDRCYVARLRLGDDVYASFPVLLHRLPPEDAEVKWAWVTARRIGERIVYQFQLTLEHASFAEPKRPAGVGDGGHVRLGWASSPDGVVVARWDGGEVVAPKTILDQGEHAPLIRGFADKHFDDVKRAVRLWMRRGPNRIQRWDHLVGDARRIQFRRTCAAFATFRLGGRLGELWKAWRAERLGAKRDLFAHLRVADRWMRARGFSSQDDRMAWWLFLWAKKDAHLRQYAADSLQRFAARRDAHYRRIAIRLATQFETMTVDKFDVAGLRTLPDLSLPGQVVNETAQHNAALAAPGRFREILLDVMGPRCTKCERPDAAKEAGAARSAKRRKTPAAA